MFDQHVSDIFLSNDVVYVLLQRCALFLIATWWKDVNFQNLQSSPIEKRLMLQMMKRFEDALILDLAEVKEVCLLKFPAEAESADCDCALTMLKAL